MCCFYHTSNTINLVTATKFTAFWVIEYCIFVKDLVDCSATHGVIFAKYVAQITKQQGRYAVGHGLSRCTHRRKVAARRGVLIVQIIDCRNQAWVSKNSRFQKSGQIWGIENVQATRENRL